MTYGRWQEDIIQSELKYRRILSVEGSRQCRKTTLAKQLANHNTIYRTLDDATVLKTALNDPYGFVKHEDALMIIDEIQRAPNLLLAMKKDVDENTKMAGIWLPDQLMSKQPPIPLNP